MSLSIELVEGSERRSEQVHLNVEDDLIFVSVALYRAFLARGQVGIDAYVLFSHLCFTGKLQQTNSVWANRAYLKKGLRWAQARLDEAMNVLTEMKLISKSEGKSTKGKFGKTFTQVHRSLTPRRTVDSPKVNGETTVDSREVKVLESTKCLNEKAIPKLEIPEGGESASSTSVHSPLPSLTLREELTQEAQKAGKTLPLNYKSKDTGLTWRQGVKELITKHGVSRGKLLEVFSWSLENYPDKLLFFPDNFSRYCRELNDADLETGDGDELPPDPYCPECHVRGGHGVFCSRPDSASHPHSGGGPGASSRIAAKVSAEAAV